MRLLHCIMLIAAWLLLASAAPAVAQPAGGMTLVVAVRSLPEYLSPATAATEVELQTLELLFDRLYQLEWQPESGKRYRPRLATALPDGSLTASIGLRNASWSSGERVTAADVRHTAMLTNQAEIWGRSALWRDYLEVPRLEGEKSPLKINFTQGLFDPVRPLTFWVLPRKYADKELARADDPEFAKAPMGSGPFRFVGRKPDAGTMFAEFQANAHDGARGPIGAIRMVAWNDVRKDAKPLPHLILDAPTDRLAEYKNVGYVDRSGKNRDRVWFLAVNHRKPALASAPLRRAMAHALDRPALLKKHFRGEAVNGLFPHESWANAPAPGIPEFTAEAARSFARQVGNASGKVEITLKHPDDDPRVKSVCEDMARAIQTLCQDAAVGLTVKAVGLTPHDLRKSMHERDYDLVYTHADGLDDPVRLALFFDRDADAVRAGGCNFLGYDSDLKLQELLRTALQHRQFSAVQEAMQAIHVHLFETMPAIPLWQLETHVLVHRPSLHASAFDVSAVFANVREWKITP